MPLKISRRLLLQELMVILVSGCIPSSRFGGELVVGFIGYDRSEKIIPQYDRLMQYLGRTLKTHVELEPVYSENKAIERIQNHSWSLVFAPPGIAAIAISRYQYTPAFPLEGTKNLRSVLIVPNDSPLQNINQLNNQTVALGQPGSATGYYFPLYNLYGLTLAQVLFAPTPQIILQWVSEGKVAAGAISLADLDRAKYRVLFTDSHPVPPGVVLINSAIQQNHQEQIRKAMSKASREIVQEAGYFPDLPVPDYRYMIAVVERVNAIATHLKNRPAQLF